MSVPVIYFDLGDTLVHGPPGDKEPFDDAVATIAELWLRGYRIGLLSDQTPGTTEESVREKLGAYGLEAYRFDLITISSEFDPPVYKPDPQIFLAALTKAGHASASAETVFVTESLSHIEAARDLGWRGIHKPLAGTCGALSGECVEDLDDLLALFPPLPVDLYLRDAPTDPGDDDFSGGAFWNSPDLWIRHNQDGGTSHQSPLAGTDNWFYTRVRNRGVGIARIFWVGYAVKEWAGTQFVYPGDYWPYLAFTFGVSLDPGDTTVVHAKWEAAHVPAAGTHACWLAVAQADNDPTSAGAHVWEQNNLAQKNLAILDAAPGESGELSLVLGTRQAREADFFTVELFRPRDRIDLPVSLVGGSGRSMAKLVQAGRRHVRKGTGGAAARNEVAFRFIEGARVELSGAEAQESRVTLDLGRGSILTLTQGWEEEDGPAQGDAPVTVPAGLLKEKDGATALVFEPGRASGIGIALRPGQIVPARLRFTVPKDAKPGERVDLELVQRGEDGRIVGGISVQIHVRKPTGRKPGKAKQTKNKPAAKRRRVTRTGA